MQGKINRKIIYPFHLVALLTIFFFGCKKNNNNDDEKALSQLQSSMKKSATLLSSSSMQTKKLKEESEKLYIATEKEKKALSLAAESIQSRILKLEALEKRTLHMLVQWKKIKENMDKRLALLTAAEEAYKAAQKDWNKTGEAFKKTAKLYKEAKAHYETASLFFQHLNGSQHITKLLKKSKGLKRLAKKTTDTFVREIKKETKKTLRHHGKEIAKDFVCKTITPKDFQALLEQKGIDMTNKQVLHIIPLEKGGADHPENFRLASTKETASPTSCFKQNSTSCSLALYASTQCGTLQADDYLSSSITPESFRAEVSAIFQNSSRKTLDKILSKLSKNTQKWKEHP